DADGHDRHLDRRTARPGGVPGVARRDDPAGPVRHARGGGGGRRLPRLGRVGVDDRCVDRRRRRLYSSLMSEPYTLKNLAEVDDAAREHGLDGFWEARVARGALEAEQTGVAFFRLKPGRRSAFAHRPDEAEEMYVVLRVRGRMKLDDQIVEVAPLDAVRVSPHVVRAFEAGAAGSGFLCFRSPPPADGALGE